MFESIRVLHAGEAGGLYVLTKGADREVGFKFDMTGIVMRTLEDTARFEVRQSACEARLDSPYMAELIHFSLEVICVARRRSV